ncbi:hypothetical protein KUTG_08934 [Kutzneria sp. 744]|nr:hypothetical protein KUTG_08934 [Kutzneria sp. 744]
MRIHVRLVLAGGMCSGAPVIRPRPAAGHDDDRTLTGKEVDPPRSSPRAGAPERDGCRALAVRGSRAHVAPDGSRGGMMGRVSSIATVAGVDLSSAAQVFRLCRDTHDHTGGRMSGDAAARGAALFAAGSSFAALSSAGENKIQCGSGRSCLPPRSPT